MKKKYIEVINKNSEGMSKINTNAFVSDSKIIYFDKCKVEIEKNENDINIIRSISDTEKIYIHLGEISTCKYKSKEITLNLSIKLVESIFNDELIKINYVVEETENIEILINIGGSL